MMPHEYLDQIREPGQTVNPLFTFLGIEVVDLTPDRATLHLLVKPELIQGAGVGAGGVCATLLDEAMAHAVLGGNNPGELTSTIDMNVSYFRPVSRGDLLTCRARVAKRGKRVVFAEAVVSVDGNEAAKGSASFMILQAPDV